MNHGNQVINGYANLVGYTDVDPYEVIGKIGEKTLIVLEMDAERDPSWKPEEILGASSLIQQTIIRKLGS